MFKFNFNLEDAEDIDNLVPESGPDNLEPDQELQDTTESELEPFTEHTLNQLVCPQSITPTTPPERDPVRFSAGQDILFSTLYTTVVRS